MKIDIMSSNSSQQVLFNNLYKIRSKMVRRNKTPFHIDRDNKESMRVLPMVNTSQHSTTSLGLNSLYKPNADNYLNIIDDQDHQGPRNILGDDISMSNSLRIEKAGHSRYKTDKVKIQYYSRHKLDNQKLKEY